jgi:hypothetical protein
VEKNDPFYHYYTEALKMLHYLYSHTDSALKEGLKTLKTCLRIIRSSPERKRKLRAKIIAQTNKELHQNVKMRIASIEMREKLPALYGTLNKTLKRANVKLGANVKKSLRNKGQKLLRNNTRNPINRAGNLQDMIDSALGKAPTVETTNNFMGGYKTRKQKH